MSQRKAVCKSILSAGLAFVLALAVLLSACGDSTIESKDKENVREEKTAAGSVDSSVNDNAALAKENVYRVSEVEIPEMADDGSVSVACAARLDDRICAVMKISDWEKGDKYYAFSVDESGNSLQTVFLELSGDDAQEDTAGKAAAEPDPNEWQQEDVRYSDFAIGTDGKVYALRQYNYSYINYLTDQSRDERHQYVCCWDADGSLLWETEPWEDSPEDLSVWAVLPAADGSLELLLTGDAAYRLPMGRDGSVSGADREKLSEATSSALENCRRLLPRENGSFLLLCRDAGDGLSLIQYDLQTDTLGETFGLPDDLPVNSLGDTVFAAGKDSDLIYADRDGVFAYDMGDEQSCLKMNYVNSDRNITETHSLLELDGTRFFMFYKEDYTRELKAGIFEYVEPEDIPDKAVILLGGLTVNAGIRKRVIQYNRENDKYRVVIREFGSCDDLNLAIVSGDMPDILMAESLPDGKKIPMESYIAKGLIANVGTLIEGDEELSRTEFLENVFEAYSVDGKLMYVVPSFTLFTMAVKSSLVGDGDGWSMERMLEVLDGMGPDARLLDGLSRNAFLETVMRYCGNDLIDLETGKCTFDSPDFIKMMEYAYTLPEDRSWAGQSGEGEYEQQYLKNRTLLKELHIWSFSQEVDERLFYQLNGYLGGDYTFVGFPAVSREMDGSGSGALICAQNLMALSAGSDNLDGAWNFARYYLTDDYQKSLESSLPVNRQIFEEWAGEETLRPYYTDESGARVEYDLTLYQGGEPFVVPPLDQKQLEQVIALVESATETPFENVAVMNIINEEMGSYFSGQKTAEDVAAIIQNRVQLYVKENTF